MIRSANGRAKVPALKVKRIPEVAFATIGGLLLVAAPRRHPIGTLVRLAGLVMLGVAAAPMMQRRVRRAGMRRRQLAFHESLEINRSVVDVFAFFKDFENFPKVIGALHSVTDYQDGRSHWTAYSPSGHVVEWDATVTKYVPNSVIGWESVARSKVESRGIVRFVVLSPTRTSVAIDVTYRPAKTTFGDALRALTTQSLTIRLHRDLEHIRFYLESLPPRLVEGPEPQPESDVTVVAQ
ncbi:MAG: SRPBCC family protein [bacterium]